MTWETKSVRIQSLSVRKVSRDMVGSQRTFIGYRLSLIGLSLVAVTLVTLTLGGCQGTSSEATNESGRVKVRLALNWFPEPEHGGYYAALLGGDFAAEGFDVEIIPGGPDSPVIPRLVRGQVEFGVDSAEKVLIQRGQGADVAALFAPLQTSPRCILTHRSSGIDSFEKLRDVSMSVGVGPAYVKYLQSKLPLENVQLVPYSGRLGLFLGDPKQAVQGFSFSEPILARGQGVEVNVLMVSDLGFNPYTSCIVVDRSYLSDHPEVAERFVRACRKGWQRYLADPEAVHAEIARLNPELDAAALPDAHAALQPLCEVSGGGVLGGMTEERWTLLRDQLAELEFIDPRAEVSAAFENVGADSP